MKSRPNVCPWINLPVQAGSDRILREMNRKYTRAEYIALAGRIRGALPEVGLTTDLIVGFPGETEEEFEESVSLLEELRFDLAHTAAYSPREGTPAASREQVPREERARRLVRANGVQTEISRQINAGLTGREYEVLLDEPAPKGEGLLQGRTASDKVVLVRAPLELAGTFHNVRITSSSPWCLEGELI
jgi:tRNA-2-methylthio-N6-dimethylallyladenosine synthase